MYLRPYNYKGSFKFWCQTVLPAIYDDSLSYYELLCKLVKYLNDVIENVDNIHEDIISLNNGFEDLKAYVNNYFDNLDVQNEINNKLDEMVSNGTLQSIVSKISSARVNVSAFVNEPLSSDNISQAILTALTGHSKIYIPAGDYTLHCDITVDCDVLADSNATFHPEDGISAFKFTGCSVRWIGGNFNDGNPSKYMREFSNGSSIFVLDNCHDSVVDGVYCKGSRRRRVILITNCENIIVQRSTFDTFLNSAIFIEYHNDNIKISECTFKNALIADGRYFCYFVYTGSNLFTDQFVPPDGIIFENNYCENSEDSGLDTHGASNVIFRNNVITNAATCITAYNDQNRAWRPDNWVMENIIIENNICRSTVTNDQHQIGYVFLSATGNSRARNYIIRNNIFSSPKNITTGSEYLCTVEASKIDGLIFENNLFDGQNKADHCIWADRSNTIKLSGNTFVGYMSHILKARAASGVVENNNYTVSFIGDYKSNITYFDGQYSDIRLNSLHCVKRGDIINRDSVPYLVTDYGIRILDGWYADNIVTTTAMAKNGVLTLPTTIPYCVGLNLLVDTENCYITRVINNTDFTVDVSIPDGEHTVKVRKATLHPVLPYDSGIRLSNVNMDDVTNVGCYFIQTSDYNTIENLPAGITKGIASRVDVFLWASQDNTNLYAQRIINDPNKIFMRFKYSDNYTKWYLFSGTLVS